MAPLIFRAIAFFASIPVFASLRRYSRILGPWVWLPLVAIAIYTALELFALAHEPARFWDVISELGLLALCWTGFIFQYVLLYRVGSIIDDYRAQAVTAELSRAIARHELVLYYQPIVRLQEVGYPVDSYEALIRWHHPSGSLWMPSEFIETAEQSVIICDVFEWVLAQSLQQIRNWHLHYAISINFSPSQFRYTGSDRVDRIAAILRNSGVPAHLIHLEITETAIDQQEEAIAILEQLCALGFVVVLDDFGAKHSGFTRLIHLPFVEVLKLDREIMPGTKISQDQQRAIEVVRSVIDLAHQFGLKVISEGVETWTQAQILCNLGCDYAQGYYFDKPKPPSEVGF